VDPLLCGVDDVPDELHAATASARPASGTAQRALLGIERTALLCQTVDVLSTGDCRLSTFRLSTIDPLVGASLRRDPVLVDTRFFTICYDLLNRAGIRYFL
jgi:hypothetical protein